MSGAPVRVGRNYTAARRHPWVLGKVGEWKIWFGPYTPIQLSVAFLGAFTLIKTVDWWAPLLGPLPVIGWAVAVWAVRGTRVAGREPLSAVLGWGSLLIRPRAGRINGRTARDRKSRALYGGFVIEDAPGRPGEVAEDAPPVQARPAPAPRTPRPAPRRSVPRRPSRRTPPRTPAPVPQASVEAAPLSPLHQLLATSSRSSS